MLCLFSVQQIQVCIPMLDDGPHARLQTYKTKTRPQWPRFFCLPIAPASAAPKTQMLLEGVEVPVVVQQGAIVLDAPRCNQGVDGLADREAERTQATLVPRSIDRKRLATERHDLQRRQQLSGLGEVAFAAEALQYFRQDQVADGDGLRLEQLVQSIGRDRIRAPEIVDPDAGIDQDHLSVRISAKSPWQLRLQRKRRSASCCRSRSKVRKPSSTTSRLVPRPVGARCRS